MFKKYSIIVFLFLGCTHIEYSDIPTNPIRYPSPNHIYKRDSLYIAVTVKEFMNKKADIFDAYKQEGIPINKVNIDIDSILYSPDSLKLFSFVIIKNPEDSTHNKHCYVGDCFIGYRPSLKTPWFIYYFNQYTPAGFDNYNKIRNLTYYDPLGSNVNNCVQSAQL
jgi:hypothetical protein